MSAQDNEATIREIFRRISAHEFDRLGELMTEDLHFELPYGPEGFREMTDLATWNRMQLATFAMFTSFQTTVHAIHPAADESLAFAEYESDAVVKHNGKPYRNTYIGMFRFRDGRVCAWKEFHDPGATDALT